MNQTFLGHIQIVRYARNPARYQFTVEVWNCKTGERDLASERGFPTLQEAEGYAADLIKPSTFLFPLICQDGDGRIFGWSSIQDVRSSEVEVLVEER